MIDPDYQLCLRLAAEAATDPRTVRKVMEGKLTSAKSEKCVREAAKRLGIKLPPQKPKS